MTSLGKIDPHEFDVTISALLIGLGAENYVNIFRKHNIGQCTLLELTDEDLIKLGIDDDNIRTKLLIEVKNLPIFEESSVNLSQMHTNLNHLDVADILEESSQHLYRIYLSMMANSLAIKKTKDVRDCLIYKDQYASDIALETLSEISNIINSMDITLHTQMKVKSKRATPNKIIVGSAGSILIGVLAVLFVKSIKDLK